MIVNTYRQRITHILKTHNIVVPGFLFRSLLKLDFQNTSVHTDIRNDQCIVRA